MCYENLKKGKVVISCPEEMEQDRPREEAVVRGAWEGHLQQGQVVIVYAQNAVIGCRILKDSHATK